MDHDDKQYRLGLVYGLSCYLVWGIIPLFFKLLKAVPPWEIVANRILWSLGLMLILSLWRRRLADIVLIMCDVKLMRMLTASAAFIAINWLVYIWSVSNNHLLAASLGYFLNPLVNVALGIAMLGERLRKAQMIAVGIAAIGVVIAAAGALSELWISIVLALTFGIYGLIRKQAAVNAIEGLAVETMILAPLCIIGLIWQSLHGALAFGHETSRDVLLISSSVVTSVPLIVFAMAARRLPYATLGLIQYVSPSIIFLIATLCFHERLLPQMLTAFLFIWTALAIFSADLVHAVMNRRIPA